MALICPNCGGDTIQDLPGNGIKCLECGKFSDHEGTVRENRADDPESLQMSATDHTDNPQVSDRVAAGVTSAIGSAFAPPAYDAPKGSTENDPAPALDDPARFATEAAEKMEAVDAEEGDPIPEPNVPGKEVTNPPEEKEDEVAAENRAEDRVDPHQEAAEEAVVEQVEASKGGLPHGDQLTSTENFGARKAK